MSLFDFNSVIDRSYRRLGDGGILGITNFHDERYEQFVQRPGYERQNLGNAVYIPEKDMLIVKGQTIPTKEGPLCAIGIASHKHIPEHASLEETIKIIQEQNGIIIVPGPYRPYGLGAFLENHPRYLKSCDAIEVFNGQGTLWIPGPLPRHANERALTLYKRMKQVYPNLGAITASNGSSLRELGRNNTSMKMPEHYSEFQTSEDVTAGLRRAIRGSAPERAEHYSAWWMELVHYLTVKLDHNPLSYRINGVPNAHLDPLFERKGE